MKRNIALLIPKLTGGGAERVASNLSLHLPDEYERFIILFDGEKLSYPYRGEIIDLKTKAAGGPIGKLLNLAKRIIKLRRIKRKLNIHTTISFLEGPNLVNLLTRRGDRVIVSIRNNVSKSATGPYGKLYNLLMRLLYNRADKVVAVSQAIKEDLVKQYGLDPAKTQVIYNPYDMKTIQSLSQQPLKEEYRDIFSHPVIIHSGRLSMQKGQWHLIRAFKKVKEALPDTRLVLLGQGEMEGYLKDLAEELDLKEDVFFLGFQQNPFQFLARAALFAFPSLYEGFPNALAEAMACGIPVIASDCISGPREILAPDTPLDRQTQTIKYAQYGILAPVCDGTRYSGSRELTREENLWAEAIISLLWDEKLRKAYKAMGQLRIEDFSIEAIVSKWLG